MLAAAVVWREEEAAAVAEAKRKVLAEFRVPTAKGGG